MALVLLEAPCAFCKSTRWCGRQCAHAPKSAAAPVANVSHVANAAVANNVANVIPMANIRNPSMANVGPAAYRYRDPEKRRAYMRDYMRRRRQKKDTL